MLKKFRFSDWLLATGFVLLMAGAGCKKIDSIDTSTSDNLIFSTNIVKFDTVFTTIGSATHNFTVKNPYKKALSMNISLQGGSNSYFRINIDGRATTSFPNYQLAAGDSFYIFAEVTINPNAANLPFIVSDTILFFLNGHTQKVALQAFGQNAHFINNRVLGCDTTIMNDGKPVVLYDTAYVRPGCSLTIQPGVTVYCHHNAVLLIGGELYAAGTKNLPITFRQDRLEHAYDDQPGQWFGIRFLTGGDSSYMEHVSIGEGTVGIEVDTFAKHGSQTHLTMQKCIIKNMSNAALAGIGASINATNCLFYSSGMWNIYCDLGGRYNFTHCTSDLSVNLVTNRVPSIHLDNQVYVNFHGQAVPQPLVAAFRNCIIWGNLDDETELQNAQASTPGSFDTLFSHNIMKALKVHFRVNNIYNQFPNFANQGIGDYHLDTLSPAINAGVLIPSIPVPEDLDDYPRDSKPDIGCYEFKP